MIQTLQRPADIAPPHQWRGYTLLRVGPALWRVCARDGVVIGHLARDDAGAFEARRFRVAARRFASLGRFWSAEDALETLHHAR